MTKSSEITKKNLGTYVTNLNEKMGCLLWMDEPKELQLMLKKTNSIAGKYHIEFGEEKSNVMKKAEAKISLNSPWGHEHEIYGQIQVPGVHTKQNNTEDCIKALKGKVENAYQTLLATARNLNNKAMQTNTKLHRSRHSMQPRNLESMKNWTGKNQQNLGQHDKNNTNGITEYPQRSAVHWNRVAGSRSNETKNRS